MIDAKEATRVKLIALKAKQEKAEADLPVVMDKVYSEIRLMAEEGFTGIDLNQFVAKNSEYDPYLVELVANELRKQGYTLQRNMVIW